MSDQRETHIMATQAIHWLRSYYASLREWIASIDATFLDNGWHPSTPNRVSNELGAGYKNSTDFLVTWVWRHYWKPEADETIFAFLNYGFDYAQGECPSVIFARISHRDLLPLTSIKNGAEIKTTAAQVHGRLWADWKETTHLIKHIQELEPMTVAPCSDKDLEGFYNQAEECWFLHVPLDAFGNDGSNTKAIIEDVLEKLWKPQYTTKS